MHIYPMCGVRALRSVFCGACVVGALACGCSARVDELFVALGALVYIFCHTCQVSVFEIIIVELV